MVTLTPTKCCGLVEIDRLGTETNPATALRAIQKPLLYGNQIAPNHLHPAPPFVIFSGVTNRIQADHTYVRRKDDYGEKFANYLITEGLGTVTRSEERVNGSTGNTIRVWIWHPHYDALRVWNG